LDFLKRTGIVRVVVDIITRVSYGKMEKSIISLLHERLKDRIPKAVLYASDSQDSTWHCQTGNKLMMIS